MKREKATEVVKERIESWLDIKENGDAVRSCPFTGLISCQIVNDNFTLPFYCERFFPTSKYLCPCHKFSLNYVRRVARELIASCKKRRNKDYQERTSKNVKNRSNV